VPKEQICSVYLLVRQHEQSSSAGTLRKLSKKFSTTFGAGLDRLKSKPATRNCSLLPTLEKATYRLPGANSLPQ